MKQETQTSEKKSKGLRARLHLGRGIGAASVKVEDASTAAEHVERPAVVPFDHGVVNRHDNNLRNYAVINAMSREAGLGLAQGSEELARIEGKVIPLAGHFNKYLQGAPLPDSQERGFSKENPFPVFRGQVSDESRQMVDDLRYLLDAGTLVNETEPDGVGRVYREYSSSTGLRFIEKEGPATAADPNLGVHDSLELFAYMPPAEQPQV